MVRLALVALIFLYVVWLGQNWATYAGALMFAALRNDYRRSRERFVVALESGNLISGGVSAISSSNE